MNVHRHGWVLRGVWLALFGLTLLGGVGCHEVAKNGDDAETLRELRAELASVRDENAQLRKELARIEKIADARTVPLVVGCERGGRRTLSHEPRIDGSITRFDVGTNLVEVDKGIPDGVKLGHVFDIVRGDNFICAVVVDRVDEKRSVGHIEVHGTNGNPQPGDLATKL